MLQIESRLDARVDGVFTKALDWVVSHLACFDPRHPYVQDHTLRVKPFLELVFVLNPFLRLGLHHSHPDLGRIKTFIEETFEAYDFQAFAHHDPAGLMVFALRNEFYTITGQPEKAADGVLEGFLASGVHKVVERSRIPFRVMDLHYALDRASGQFNVQSHLQLYPLTVLSRGRSLAHCNSNDLYSITHTLFYLSDLGQVSLRAVLPDEADHLQQFLQNALAMMLRQQNLDLAGEFLMCLSFLEVQDTPMVARAWECLQKEQLHSGAMPAPTYSPLKQAELPECEQDSYEFTQCYHTTLVALGAAAMRHRKQVNA